MQVKDNNDNERPLSSAALHILLALAESDLHGYGIMQSVKRQSEGTFKLGPGTLYANLDRLLAGGLVGETERKLKGGETRREYCLTSSGERVLRLPWVRKPSFVLDVRPAHIDFDGDAVRVGERASIRATRPVELQDDVRCGIPGYEESGRELYADALVVHDDPFDYELTGNCAYRSSFHYSS